MMRCQTCGTENVENSQFCDECGASLRLTRGSNNAADDKPQIEMPNLRARISADAPVFQSSKATSIGEILPVAGFETPKKSGEFFGKAAEKSGNVSLPTPSATLIIERGESTGTEFALAADESFIGRWDADNGVFPDVDLDRHDPEAKISRRHARIICRAGKFLIEDLGSTNGTFVNRGRRLIPGSPNHLNSGDEIIIGKTFLRFYINE